jgi:hypothetical protein
MKIAGRVIGDGGTIRLDVGRLPKGRVEVVYVGKGGWVLDTASKKRLLTSLAQGRRGEVFDAAAVLAELPRRK